MTAKFPIFSWCSVEAGLPGPSPIPFVVGLLSLTLSSDARYMDISLLQLEEIALNVFLVEFYSWREFFLFQEYL